MNIPFIHKRYALQIVSALFLAASLTLAKGVSGASVKSGDIIVADPFASGGRSILGIDSATGEQRIISTGGLLGSPMGVVVDANGAIFVTDYNLPGVIRVDSETGEQTVVSLGGSFSLPIGIAIAPTGRLFVADIATHAVIEVNPTNGDQRVISAGGSINSPWGVAVATNGSIYVVERYAKSVIKIDPVTGAQETIITSATFALPLGVAVEANGNILVVDGDARAIFRVDPSSGTLTTVTPVGRLIAPSGIVVAGNGEILVTAIDSSSFSWSVMQVEPVSGMPNIVSLGGMFGNPFGIAIVSIDSDKDGVPDDFDECPGTPSGEIVNGHGCSLEQIAPCAGPWSNHHGYVKAVRLAVKEFVAAKLITKTAGRDVVKRAIQSTCGK